jgi:hypothetical protein
VVVSFSAAKKKNLTTMPLFGIWGKKSSLWGDACVEKVQTFAI